MQQEGPLLNHLLRRLTECPSEFIETCAGDRGAKQTIAIISDHFRCFQNANPIGKNPAFFKRLRQASPSSAESARHWGLLSVAVWLLHDDWFLARDEFAEAAWKWLQSDSLAQLAEMIKPAQCVADPDRREELTRICLAALGLRPQGETIEQATDRKATLDSVERKRILAATAAAEKTSARSA